MTNRRQGIHNVSPPEAGNTYHGKAGISGMKKWLEYETASGHIVCAITVDGEDAPGVQSGHAVIEAPDDWNGDTDGWLVRDGVLMRVVPPKPEHEETAPHWAVKLEYEWRVKQIMSEFTLAMLRDDAEEIAKLKAEYRRLEARI